MDVTVLCYVWVNLYKYYLSIDQLFEHVVCWLVMWRCFHCLFIITVVQAGLRGCSGCCSCEKWINFVIFLIGLIYVLFIIHTVTVGSLVYAYSWSNKAPLRTQNVNSMYMLIKGGHFDHSTWVYTSVHVC